MNEPHNFAARPAAFSRPHSVNVRVKSTVIRRCGAHHTKITSSRLNKVFVQERWIQSGQYATNTGWRWVAAAATRRCLTFFYSILAKNLRMWVKTINIWYNRCKWSYTIQFTGIWIQFGCLDKYQRSNESEKCEDLIALRASGSCHFRVFFMERIHKYVQKKFCSKNFCHRWEISLQVSSSSLLDKSLI